MRLIWSALWWCLGAPTRASHYNKLLSDYHRINYFTYLTIHIKCNWDILLSWSPYNFLLFLFVISILNSCSYGICMCAFIRNLPRAIMIGLPIIIVVYLLINISLFAILSIQDIIVSDSEAIAVVSVISTGVCIPYI